MRFWKEAAQWGRLAGELAAARPGSPLSISCTQPYRAVPQVYCLDAQFVGEMGKFVAGSLQALSAMVQLELPHVNVLTKVDLCKDKVG